MVNPLRKPKVIFTLKDFAGLSGLGVGDQGQLEVDLKVYSEDLVLTEDHNEIKRVMMYIESAKIINNKPARVDNVLQDFRPQQAKPDNIRRGDAKPQRGFSRKKA